MMLSTVSSNRAGVGRRAGRRRQRRRSMMAGGRRERETESSHEACRMKVKSRVWRPAGILYIRGNAGSASIRPIYSAHPVRTGSEPVLARPGSRAVLAVLVRQPFGSCIWRHCNAFEPTNIGLVRAFAPIAALILCCSLPAARCPLPDRTRQAPPDCPRRPRPARDRGPGSAAPDHRRRGGAGWRSRTTSGSRSSASARRSRRSLLSQTRATYAPLLFSNTTKSSNSNPPQNFLGGQRLRHQRGRSRTTAGSSRLLKWGGGSYRSSLDGARNTTSDRDRSVQPAARRRTSTPTTRSRCCGISRSTAPVSSC